MALGAKAVGMMALLGAGVSAMATMNEDLDRERVAAGAAGGASVVALVGAVVLGGVLVARVRGVAVGAITVVVAQTLVLVAGGLLGVAVGARRDWRGARVERAMAGVAAATGLMLIEVVAEEGRPEAEMGSTRNRATKAFYRAVLQNDLGSLPEEQKQKVLLDYQATTPEGMERFARTMTEQLINLISRKL